jgi:hypothetical protein
MAKANKNIQHELNLSFEDDLPINEHLNNFVDAFYLWHSKTGFATIKRSDWTDFIKLHIA